MQELFNDFTVRRRALANAKIALVDARIDVARMRASLLMGECASMKNERVESAAIEMHPQYMAAVDAKTKAAREVLTAESEYDIIRMAVRLIEIEIGMKRGENDETDTEDGDTDEDAETE